MSEFTTPPDPNELRERAANYDEASDPDAKVLHELVRACFDLYASTDSHDKTDADIYLARLTAGISDKTAKKLRDMDYLEAYLEHQRRETLDALCNDIKAELQRSPFEKTAQWTDEQVAKWLSTHPDDTI